MPSTPILGITQVSTSQSAKETTINDAIMALEAATNAKLSVSMTAGDVTLTATEATRNFIFVATAATVDRQLKFPIAVNGNDYNRIVVVRNESGYGLTVKFASGAGSTVTIPNGQSRLINAADGLNMTVAAEPPSVINFLSLTDSPDSYTGQHGKVLAVNVAENALEFITVANFPAFAGNVGKFLVVNSTATGVEWLAPDFAEDFLDLNDTPATFAGQAGKLVAVNAGATALEFIDQAEAEAVQYVAAQRWRLFALETGEWPENPPELDPSDPEYITATSQVGFGEIEWLDQDGVDLATGGTASASNAESGFEASKGFDNDTTNGTGWRTDAAYTGDAWIEYMFAAPVTPRKVRLTSIGNYPQYSPMRFLIQYYDGTVWVDLGDRTAASWETAVPQSFKINGVPYDVVQEAPEDGLTYGRKDGSWTAIASATVVTDATTSHDLAASEVGTYRRFTNGGSKTLQVRTNAVHAMPDGEWHIHNQGAGTLVVVPSVGVTVNTPPDGTLKIPQGGTVTIKRVTTDVYDMFGSVVKTTDIGVSDVFPTLTGNAGKILAVNASADNIEWVEAYTDEKARDALAAALVAGANITITPNDGGDTITIAVSGSLGLNAEDVRDTIGNALVAGTGIEIVVDDATDQITITNTGGGGGGGGGYTDEMARDALAAALVAGANISITPDDVGNTITIAVAGSLGLSAEDVRDTVGATLVAGDNIAINVNDAGDTITISTALGTTALAETWIGARISSAGGATQAVASTALTTITNLTNVEANTGGFSTASSRIVIPTGVSKVRIQGQVATTATVTANAGFVASIQKNGSIVAAQFASSGYTNPNVSLSTGAIDVVPGDIIILSVQSTDSAYTVDTTGTYLEVTAIEGSLLTKYITGAPLPVLAGQPGKLLAVKSDESGVEWVPATNSLGGIPDLIAEFVADGTASSYTFSGITQNWKDLIVEVVGRTDNAAQQSVTLRANGLSTAIYDLQRVYTQTGTTAGDQTLSGTGMTLVQIPGTGYAVGYAGFMRAEILDYKNTTLFKEIALHGRQPNSTTTGNSYIIMGSGQIRDQNPITSLTISTVGNFFAGSTIRLYGRGANGAILGTPVAVNDLSDVDTVTSPPSTGYVLTWDNALGVWKPAAVSAIGRNYSVPMGFVSAPTGSETLLLHTFAEAVNFSGNFAGAAKYVGTNPALAFVIDVQRSVANGAFASIGSISISTAGVATYTTTGGAVMSFGAGDTMRLVAPAGTDGSIANVAITLKGLTV